MTQEFLADCGVIYVATGSTYRDDAIRSAASLKLHNPDLPVCLFSDIEPEGHGCDHFRKIENPHARSKLACMARSPFRLTLFLDSDTLIAGPLADPFALLEHFDFAMTLAKMRTPEVMRSKGYGTDGVPAGFYPHNSGVIYYRLTPATLDFFHMWDEAFRHMKPRYDQIVLRELLWRHPEIRVYNLPAEYNAREISLILATHPRMQATRVLHLPLYNTKWGWWKRVGKTLAKLQGPFVRTGRFVKILASARIRIG